MTHNINQPQEPTPSRPSQPNTPNSSHEPQIPRTSIPPTSTEQRTSNQTPEIATQNVQREILVKILEEWVHDTTATGNKTEATNRILDCFDSKKTDLKLDNLEINKLPDCLRFLPNLESLNLSNNTISNFSIPRDSLNNLQYLNLSRNEIRNFTIPSGSLNNLQYLILHANQISNFSIPSGSLNNLRNLHLDYNQITNFPIPSDSLNNLQELNLSFNQITNFNIPCGSLNNLQGLELQNNKITDFPIPSDSLNNLQELYLSDNQITNFSIPRDSLHNIQSLNLSYNTPLRTISITSPLHLLYELSVDNNPNLHELPLLLGRSARLTHIDTDSSSPQLRSSARAILEATQLLRRSASKEKLPAALNLWKSYVKDSELDTTRILSALTPDNQRTVYEWLVRLSRSVDFKSNQRNLASVVCHILKDLTNKDFRDLALSQMSANNECCQDRASMALNELYLSWALLCGNSKLPPKERLEMIAKAGRTLALREAIANQLAGRPDIAESVETYLYYETHLANSLGLLTCIKDMSYPPCAIPLNEQKLRDYVEKHYLKKAAEIPNLEEIMQEDPEGRTKIHEIKLEALKASSSLLEARPENVSEHSPEMLEWTIRYNQLKQTLDKELLDFRVAWLQERLSKKS